jgi:hypothetical protein
MKKLIIISTIFLLVVGVLSVTFTTASGAEAEQQHTTKTLTVKLGEQTFLSEGPFDKGDRIYGEYDLIDPEDEGYTIIGHYIYDSIRTTPLDETPVGWYASEHFSLDGLGAIETVGEGPPWGGAIIGGTGIFVGASGEWHAEDGICIFTFEKPVKLP